jgi:hypothetical protein
MPLQESHGGPPENRVSGGSQQNGSRRSDTFKADLDEKTAE